MTVLGQYGWERYTLLHTNIQPSGDLETGRIISIQGFKYITLTENGEAEAELSGKLLHGATSTELPHVGDWVVLRMYESTGYIIDVLPRTCELTRKSAGTSGGKQVLAANVDTALIVQAVDRDFNTMRLDRYLVQMAACGIEAIVVLNKTDTVPNADVFVQQVESLQRACVVLPCSTYSGFGLDTLLDLLKPEHSYVMIGSSGVGKSSLTNALMNSQTQRVGGTSESSGKGRHTTTTRNLFRLPNGSLLIDTPGMREFGLTGDEDTSSEVLFPAIQRFAGACKFNDCLHEHEAGCAVLQALDNGELSHEMYDSYRKLRKERSRFEINAEEKKRMNKQSGRITREASLYRKKYKY